MARFHAQRGYSLIEALVAILVGVIALLGLYELVDASNKLTKQQTEVADVQQSARIGISELSRIIRQSRVGGLYFGNAVLPIANNISGGTFLLDLSDPPQDHFIRQGTDVIEVRGVILGDKYILSEGDVTCSGSCATTTQITVIIKATAGVGNPPFVNFPNGVKPSLAGKTRPFYFVVQNGDGQQVAVGASTYVVPLYLAGLVLADKNPSWYTWDTAVNPNTFTFKMNPQDAGAKKLNATTTLPTSLTKSVVGGAIDVVRFFVDEGGSDATGLPLDSHPSLAEAILDPATASSGSEADKRWDIQPLIEEVEDFQIAYGVDGIDGKPRDSGVSPVAVDLSGVNKDEWVGNVAGEVPTPSGDPPHVDAFIDTSVLSGQPAVPALRSVWISLVVKSTDPDFVYDGPGARGIKILDSAAVSFSAAPPAGTGRPYRRRPLSLAVSLRNNALSNK